MTNIMRNFPFHLGLSNTIVSAFMLCQMSQPVQAQNGNQSDVTGAIVTTSDISGGTFIHSQPGGRGLQFSSVTVQAGVYQAAAKVVNQLNLNSLTSPAGTPIPPETQQLLLRFLTTSRSVQGNGSIEQITNALSSAQGGPTVNQAQQLANSLEGLLKTGTANPSQIKINPARLMAALKAYNQLIDNSSAEFLNNPPSELLGIGSVLSELSKALS
ncbi:MAG: hypothetical protein DSM106950_08060 [Stigonema ocellatum SAG 48.90 = DSM 106950]|nr:hypothetical protein [Stigonema ocellatum SAG 48.90 = DSM 106950]